VVKEKFVVLACSTNSLKSWPSVVGGHFQKQHFLRIVSHHIYNVLHYDISNQQKKVDAKQTKGHARLETKVLPLRKRTNLFTKFCKFLSLVLYVDLNPIPSEYGLFPIFPLTKLRSIHEC